MRFSHAIVRAPCPSFADGLTTAGLGKPDVAKALAQHEAYVRALRLCGLDVTALPPDDDHPDSTFVEDTAVISAAFAVATRPGAPSREGEVAPIRALLADRFDRIGTIEAPGTLDGGDICDAGERFFLGVSHRTNEAGAAQLKAFLEAHGRPSTNIDIRGVPGILHLKSGVSAIAPDTLVVIDDLAGHPAFSGHRMIRVPPEEAYAANCVRVNDHVLFAAGYPRLEASLREAGFSLLTLDMSEFRKMDGGLSCLSLRY